jgi:hypothetical protein
MRPLLPIASNTLLLGAKMEIVSLAGNDPSSIMKTSGEVAFRSFLYVDRSGEEARADVIVSGF